MFREIIAGAIEFYEVPRAQKMFVCILSLFRFKASAKTIGLIWSKFVSRIDAREVILKILKIMLHFGRKSLLPPTVLVLIS